MSPAATRMLLECLPSGWPSPGTGNNTGAIGAAQPKPQQPLEGSALPHCAGWQSTAGWGEQRTRASIFQGKNALTQSQSSSMACLFLGGILTDLAWEPWVVSALLSKSPNVPGESPLAVNASILLRSQLLRHHLLLPASATLSLPASGAHDSSQHRKPRFVSNHICSNKEWERMRCIKRGTLQLTVTEETSLVFWS